MSDLDAPALALLHVYRDEVRPLLEEHKIATIDGLDRGAIVVEKALARDPRVDAGFLGESQVGKSTLINAILGQKALPSGGVGPLTAQATRITRADENRVAITYHPKKKLHQLAFAMERYLERRGELPKVQPHAADAEALTADEALEVEQAVVPASEDGATPAASAVGEYMLSQARLMLTGTENSASGPGRVTLVDGIRAILEREPRGDGSGLDALAGRIAEIRARLGQTEEITESAVGGRGNFRKELRTRAAGWLAPLVSHLRLELDTPVLERLSLVDLPGVGVVNDPAGKVAEEFVTTEADALVIVARNSGLTEAVATVLERTNVITKLLFGGVQGAPPIHVIVVITYLDEVAESHYTAEAEVARENGEPRPDRHAIFQRLAGQMATKVREQIAAALRASPQFECLPAETRDRREAIVEALCQSMDVICTSAKDYLHLKEGYEDLAFLKRDDATGIPELFGALERLRTAAVERRDAEIRAAMSNFRESVIEHLSAVGRMYETGGGRAVADWDRFRTDLDAASRPLREMMHAYHGELMATLQHAVPLKLAEVCNRGAKVAGDRLRRLKKRGDDLRYPTLNAALTRNGVWARGEIDYPDELTHAFVDVIASDWEPAIVEMIRASVKQGIERDVALVERLCEAAVERDDRIVADAHVESQKKILRQQAVACLAWTRDELERLRDDVSREIKGVVEKPLARACRLAAEEGRNRGEGAKKRILEVFEEGSRDAIDVANVHATRILRRHYDALLKRLSDGFLREHHDPLKAAFDALTNGELERARRSDAQRRRKMLERVAALSARASA